ncbi:uncharacterized protein LOC136079039 [Hydra vulgaris]|uniref:Uncharacterized protein LOC136079039 n=1 Tax=Hydra vulgaris TaxID=6087 RepID=A0ABM4BP20_HYDVU
MLEISRNEAIGSSVINILNKHEVLKVEEFLKLINDFLYNVISHTQRVNRLKLNFMTSRKTEISKRTQLSEKYLLQNKIEEWYQNLQNIGYRRGNHIHLILKKHLNKNDIEAFENYLGTKSDLAWKLADIQENIEVEKDCYASLQQLALNWNFQS